MKKILWLSLLLQITACASENTLTAADDPEIMAQNFMQHFFSQKGNLADWVIADVAFLGYNTQNSEEGQKKIHESLGKMETFLRKNIKEAGINSEHLVFKPVGKTLQNNGELANVTLHIFEPNNQKEEVNAMELITRWRKTNQGWKLDLNPYLDNFREIKGKEF